jgi:hypothetical protein
MNPDVSRHCALNRMANVVDEKGIAIGPAVDARDGMGVATEEATFQAIANARVGGNPERMFGSQKEQRLTEERSPLDAIFILGSYDSPSGAQEQAGSQKHAPAVFEIHTPLGAVRNDACNRALWRLAQYALPLWP